MQITFRLYMFVSYETSFARTFRDTQNMQKKSPNHFPLIYMARALTQHSQNELT